jgi:hypothetical protein
MNPYHPWQWCKPTERRRLQPAARIVAPKTSGSSMFGAQVPTDSEKMMDRRDDPARFIHYCLDWQFGRGGFLSDSVKDTA